VLRHAEVEPEQKCRHGGDREDCGLRCPDKNPAYRDIPDKKTRLFAHCLQLAFQNHAAGESNFLQSHSVPHLLDGPIRMFSFFSVSCIFRPG
jgi:hypothetical protein